MIRPPRGFWSFISRNASCVHRNGPVRLVATTVCHLSNGRSSIGMPALVPALLNSRSSRPNSCLVRANSALIDAGSVTSVGTASVGALPAALAVASSASLRRPASTTVQPAFASPSAEALPMPLPAPVTIAILLVIPRPPRDAGPAGRRRTLTEYAIAGQPEAGRRAWRSRISGHATSTIPDGPRDLAAAGDGTLRRMGRGPCALGGPARLRDLLRRIAGDRQRAGAGDDHAAGDRRARRVGAARPADAVRVGRGRLRARVLGQLRDGAALERADPRLALARAAPRADRARPPLLRALGRGRGVRLALRRARARRRAAARGRARRAA